MTVTANGSIILIQDGDSIYNYQKSNLSIFMLNGLIEIRHNGKPIQFVTDNTTITTPASSSMSDLFQKLVTLIS